MVFLSFSPGTVRWLPFLGTCRTWQMSGDWRGASRLQAEIETCHPYCALPATLINKWLLWDLGSLSWQTVERVLSSEWKKLQMRRRNWSKMRVLEWSGGGSERKWGLGSVSRREWLERPWRQTSHGWRVGTCFGTNTPPCSYHTAPAHNQPPFVILYPLASFSFYWWIQKNNRKIALWEN